MTRYHKKKHHSSHKKSYHSHKRNFGNCSYHLCDKKGVELFRCKYCREYFCREHLYAKIPQTAPFKSTDIDRHIEWDKKGGHPCLPYFYYKTSKEKESKRIVIPEISKLQPIIDHVTEPEISELEEEISMPEPIVHDIPKPKISSPIISQTDTSNKKKRNIKKYYYKVKKWFFWKKHPRNYLRKKTLLKHLGLLILVSFLFWLVYSNITTVNSAVLWFIKFGSLIEIILAIFFIYYLYKILVNLKYGMRGTFNGVKLIIGISALIVFVMIVLNPIWISQPFNDFNYDTLNPISTGSSSDISIKNPTYSQMEQFILEDTTDSNQYVFYSYVCEDFSRDIIENAKDKGIRAAMVYLNNPMGAYSGHAIVAFETSDRGLYFAESQLDVIFSEGYMNNMVARGIYDIQTLYGGTYYSYTEYFNMPLSSYSIQYWNDDILQGTPGFELIVFLVAFGLIFIFLRKKSKRGLVF